MSHESQVYALNLAIAAILAALLTEYWRRAGRGTVLGVWAAGAWVMAVADLLFASRPWLPASTGRLLPTLLVTVGLGTLLIGAQMSAGRRRSPGAVVGVALFHGAVLAAFLAFDGHSPGARP